MDGEPLKGGLSSYTQLFEEVFPFYLSIGMSYEQFWYKDPHLVVPYRKAHELRRQQRNQELWLQGAYFAHAINATVGNMFSSKSTRKVDYPTEPLPITENEIAERREREAREKMEKIKASFISAALRVNKDMPKK